ncbi:MAG: 30S ribosomal protein S15 [Rickettsiales bacterium]|nr:30S ribosomal protein S15 [Rickettsiales bacterium]
MSILKEKKKEIIEKFKKEGHDAGSTSVQVAILTERINNLTAHLKIHKKDNHCRYGLIILVGRRKKLLKYLYKKNPDEYHKLIKELNIRSVVK